VAVGETREEVLQLIREAIEFHIDGLKEDGLPVPAPSSEGEDLAARHAGQVLRDSPVTPAGVESRAGPTAHYFGNGW
jgi:hypothetical protein